MPPGQVGPTGDCATPLGWCVAHCTQSHQLAILDLGQPCHRNGRLGLLATVPSAPSERPTGSWAKFAVVCFCACPCVRACPFVLVARARAAFRQRPRRSRAPRRPPVVAIRGRMAAELRVFLEAEAPAPQGCPDAAAFAADLLAILDKAEVRGRSRAAAAVWFPRPLAAQVWAPQALTSVVVEELAPRPSAGKRHALTVAIEVAATSFGRRLPRAISLAGC